MLYCSSSKELLLVLPPPPWRAEGHLTVVTTAKIPIIGQKESFSFDIKQNQGHVSYHHQSGG